MTSHGLKRPFWTTPRIDTALSLLGAVVASGLALRFGLPLPWLLIAAACVLSGGIGYAVAWERMVGLYLRVKAHRTELLERVRHRPLPQADLTVPWDLPPVAKRPDNTKLADATAPIAVSKTYTDALLPPGATLQDGPAAIPPEYAAALQRADDRCGCYYDNSRPDGMDINPRCPVHGDQPVEDLVVADPVPARFFTVREMRPGDRFRYVTSTLEIQHIAWPKELEPLDMALVAMEGLGAISLTLPAAMRWQMVRAVRPASVRCLVCERVVEDASYDLALVSPVVDALCQTCGKNTAGEAM